MPCLCVDIQHIHDELHRPRRITKGVRKPQLPLLRHLNPPVIKHIKGRCRQRDTLRTIGRFRIDILTVKFCHVPEQAQRHIRVDRTLMLKEHNVAILHEETHIVFLAAEKRLIHCCDPNLGRLCYAARKRCIDLGQTLFVVEYIPKERIFVGAFCLPHTLISISQGILIKHSSYWYRFFHPIEAKSQR